MELKEKVFDEPRHRNTHADLEIELEDTGRVKGKLGRSERVALIYIHYQM